MKPIHKLNGGDGATICLACRTIIIEGFTNDVLCKVCNYHYIILSQSFDSRAEIMQAVKELAK